jgi:hypothetical protein
VLNFLADNLVILALLALTLVALLLLGVVFWAALRARTRAPSARR